MRKLLILVCLIAATSATALADNFIYGHNYGSSGIYKIDTTTGAVVDAYTNLTSGNGRGVVVVGNTMYYTDANSNAVYSYTLSTKTNNGPAFTIAGSSGLATMAYDGTDFWIGDYSGTNHAYLYTPTGTLLKTISLSKCSGFCDGLEYVLLNGTPYLLSNEFDGGLGGPNAYDLYDTNGNLIKAGFINTAGHTSGSTGVAFDGTDFFTSNIFQSSLNEWDINGNFVKTINLSGEGFFGIEDLSADYSQTLPPPTVPEPSTFVLVGSSMLGLAGAVRRRFIRGKA